MRFVLQIALLEEGPYPEIPKLKDYGIGSRMYAPLVLYSNLNPHTNAIGKLFSSSLNDDQRQLIWNETKKALQDERDNLVSELNSGGDSALAEIIDEIDEYLKFVAPEPVLDRSDGRLRDVVELLMEVKRQVPRKI